MFLIDMAPLRVLVVLLFFAKCGFGARILGVIPTPSYSHQVVFQSLWKELSLRGHQVVLCTTDPIRDPLLTNLTEIDWSFSYDIWKKYNFVDTMKNAQKNKFSSYTNIMKMVNEYHDKQLSVLEVRNLIENKNETFDLVMVEFWIPTMAAFGIRFNCPVIGITSLDPPSYVHEIFGNPTHPVLYPSVMLPFQGEMSFVERIIASVFYFWGRIILKNLDETENLLVQKHFGKDYPPMSEIRVKTVTMLLMNVNQLFHYGRPLVPSTIEVGGGMHLKKPKPLPKDINSFLDSATEGVIYFSLGSNAKSKDIPEETKKVIMETFAELPYKVLWKFENDNLPGKPPNVKISKWLPQQDVLRHPNIKVFITQGGLQSIEEAIYSHVPMVGMPYFGDQPMNVKKLVSRGMGLQVDKDNIEKESFKKTILEVIENPKYRNKVKELAELAQDQPMTGLEKAVWWTEYVIRHKGAPHLKSPAVDMPLYQYFLLDVIGFLLAVLFISLWVIYRIIKLVLRIFSKSSQLDSKKKKN